MIDSAHLPVPRTTLLVCAGDLSGDRHMARVLSRLTTFSPQLTVFGVGGPEMERQGVELLANCQSFAILGIIEPIRLLPFFARLRWQLLRLIVERKPAAVVLVDFGGFNIGFAQAIRAAHPQLPIIYFISPQVWGSRPWRVSVLKRTVTKMLVIFPFEEALYREKGINARFVGHPLTQAVADCREACTKESFCRQHDLDPGCPIIGIFPGSRRREISDHMPILLRAIQWLKQERPQLQFAISPANKLIAEEIAATISTHWLFTSKSLTLLPVGENPLLMQVADILWTKSGTTTLEAALFAKPMLIFYHANWLSYLIFLLFKQVRHVGWPNLLAGKLVVPELIQLDCRAEQLVRFTADWLAVPGATRLVAERLRTVKSRLGGGDFAEVSAAEIFSLLALQEQPDPGTRQ